MSEATQQMNAANAEFADWCQTLPISLIIAGCAIHAKVQAAMFALADERDTALKELAASSAALDRINAASEKLLSEVRRNADPGIPIYASRDATDDVLGKPDGS